MGQKWTEERRRKFAESVSKAWAEGHYTKKVELLKKERLENTEWRENQRKAASERMLKNNPMNDPALRSKMKHIKQEQFEGYELPEWYAKQGGRPIYNARFAILLKSIFEEKPVEALYGDSEKKFGRFWVDCFFPEKKLAVEWNEPFHNHTEEKDERKMNLLREHNKDITFVTLKESDIIIGRDYTDPQSRRNLVEALTDIGVWSEKAKANLEDHSNDL